MLNFIKAQRVLANRLQPLPPLCGQQRATWPQGKIDGADAFAFDVENGISNEPLPDVDIQHSFRAGREGVDNIEFLLVEAAKVGFDDRVVHFLIVMRFQPRDRGGDGRVFVARKRHGRPVFFDAAFLVFQPAAARARIVSANLVHRITDLPPGTGALSQAYVPITSHRCLLSLSDPDGKWQPSPSCRISPTWACRRNAPAMTEDPCGGGGPRPDWER